MRQREHNASNEDDNIRTARKDEPTKGSYQLSLNKWGNRANRNLFPNECEAAATALQSSAGTCRYAAPGSLPAVTLRGNQPDYRPIATVTRRTATPNSP
nr:MAG TPA: hypothetical protein [Caudoviricetes sp.]